MKILTFMFAFVFTSMAFAGSTSVSTSFITNQGQSVTHSTGRSVFNESAIGTKHLESGSGSVTSVRDSGYVRSSHTGTKSSGVEYTGFSGQAMVINTDSIGKAYGQSQASSVTYGKSKTKTLDTESGGFVAYEINGDSWSYEIGGYSLNDSSTAKTRYSASSTRYTTSENAYDIY